MSFSEPNHTNSTSWTFLECFCNLKKNQIWGEKNMGWSYPRTEHANSAQYMAMIKSLHSSPAPPAFPLLALYMQRWLWWGGGEEGVLHGRGRLCLCITGHGVSGGGDWGCLFEDSAYSPRLVSPAWLFEAVRWPHRAASLQVERKRGERVGVMLLLVGFGSLSFVYSCFFHLVQLPSSSSSSHFSISSSSLCYSCVAIASLFL